ncbi:MAG: ArsR/SmtB family transcription factor [Halobaculum sp.]
MANPLPSEPDVESDPEEARVVGVESDDAESVLSALSSDTARELLGELYEDPGPASDLAERTDTTIQNVQYHLGKLSEAGLIEVADTAYSAKGREMDVYVPADRALVVVPGGDDSDTLRDLLPELLAALVPLTALAALAEILLGGPFAPEIPMPFGAAAGGAAEGSATEADTEVAAQSTEYAAEAATDPSLLVQATNSPGVAVLLGGLFALAVAALVVWYRRW